VLVEGQQEQVRAAQARLPERQREVLVLRELEELSYDDIAAIMTTTTTATQTTSTTTPPRCPPAAVRPPGC
jgi:DNA-directed RNA polymerase specialized sigma24 family protein